MKARFCLPLLVVCLVPCANLSATGSESARQPSTGVTAVSSAEDAATTSTNSEYPIPGPLRSFLRMAADSAGRGSAFAELECGNPGFRRTHPAH